jgi:hypothetical protein
MKRGLRGRLDGLNDEPSRSRMLDDGYDCMMG